MIAPENIAIAMTLLLAAVGIAVMAFVLGGQP